MNTMDKEGNLMITYEVYVTCGDKGFARLGAGLDSVCRFMEIAEAGIPEAAEVRYLWGNNVLVTLDGRGLRAVIRRHYPEHADLLERIDPAQDYVMDCYDMS